MCIQYSPPQAPFNKFDDCLGAIQDFIDDIPGSPELQITGDFNLPFIDWKCKSINPSCTKTATDTSSGLALLEFMSTNFLEQLVDEPTRKDLNILDLVLSNNTDLIHSVSVSKTEKSDHDVVSCTLLHPQFLLYKPVMPQYIPASALDDINFNAADWSAISCSKDLLTVDWSRVVDQSTPQDTAWDLFEEEIVEVCKKHVPSHCHNRQAADSSSSNDQHPQITKIPPTEEDAF